MTRSFRVNTGMPTSTISLEMLNLAYKSERPLIHPFSGDERALFFEDRVLLVGADLEAAHELLLEQDEHDQILTQHRADREVEGREPGKDPQCAEHDAA